MIVVEDSIGSVVLFSPIEDRAHAFSGYIKEDTNYMKTIEAVI